ncbi:MAG: four helix bundle suffix domain-containing protein, partial [Patescibacteria group bacterium]
DLTVKFCRKFLISDLGNLSNLPSRRTIDQMVQAARSGKQNIVEGVMDARTSKKMEIKLLGVAAASLEELTADYEDFLRQRNLLIWPKTDEKVTKLKHYTYRLSHLSNLSYLGSLKEIPKLPQKAEVAANLLLTLCHQATYLLDRQIIKAETIFLQKGGYTENLFKRRLDSRMSSKLPK